jgi:hypothetical protein
MQGVGDQIDRPRPRTSSRSRRVAGHPPRHTIKLSFVPRLVNGLQTVLRLRHDK